ncbi:MAG: M6 family metalloprotease domain-containing protein [Dysgonamonadaceae bacterium]|jgi:M6 family metalloprotease-like protein|nr:M6 family metalloprotease domain-containing protein [Dysgonamonadaceae bacterium]
MNRLFLCLFLGCFLSSPIFGVPANPKAIEKTQPDGTKITALLKGDEKIHWLETPGGYTLMYNPEQYIVFAATDNSGNMIPSKIIYRGENPAKYSPSENDAIAKIPRNIRYSATQKEALKAIWKITGDNEKRQLSQSGISTDVIGEKRAICILMNFQDKTMVKTKEEFENLFNQLGYSAGGAYGSVRDFYRENSYGKMDFIVTVAGPYTAAKNASEYDMNSYAEFAEEAARLADADINYTDFANANNQLESFHIIFAGYGDESVGDGRQIWSHKSALREAITLDGVAIQVYSCSCELRGKTDENITHIGTVCHELCHVFGAPDYYDTDYEESGGNYQGTGKWDLMAAGNWNADGARPAHINIFQKSLFGWLNLEELSSGKAVIDMPNSTDNAVAYKIPINPDGEMYLLENMQQTGFNTNVPGHGLLIYHVHPDALSGRADNRSHPQQLYPVCAGAIASIPAADASTYGRTDVLSGTNEINSQKCPFPGSQHKTAFTDATVPAMFSWETNSVFAGKPLTNISENPAKKTVSFEFMGGNPRVETPTFSPGSDSYPDSVIVNILCATEGATIYYTVNGDTPDKTATLYVSPVKLTTPTVLKAIAYKDGLEDSFVASASYTFCALVDVSAATHVQDFENESGLGCWSAVAADPDNTNADATHKNGWGIRSGVAYNESANAWRFSSWKTATDYKQYLISPQLVVDGYGRKISFYYKKSNTNYETFAVGYSTTNNQVDGFTWGSPVTANGSDWALYSDSLIPFDAKYVAIRYLSENKYYLYVDDVVLEKTNTYTDITANKELNEEPVMLFPNPNRGEFVIAVPGVSTVAIFNAGGAKIATQRISGRHTFFLQENGVYPVRIVSEKSGQVVTKKVIVAK